MRAQFFGGLGEFLLQSPATVDAEQFQPVVDGAARVGLDVFSQGLRRSLLQPHWQHDFGQLQGVVSCGVGAGLGVLIGAIAGKCATGSLRVASSSACAGVTTADHCVATEGSSGD